MPISKQAPTLTPIPYQVLSTVVTTPINWLWKPYIPRGALTMIVGDGGYGKSWMTCAIAADLSKGRALPGQEPLPPQRILMISAEDGISQIIKPKMEVLDADMANIAAFDEGFSINPNMVNRISLAVAEFDAAIVFLDPMVAYLGGSTDMYRPNETRAILIQLDQLAKRHNIAIVGVHHVKKAAGLIAQHKTLGSVDFVNGVRSTLLVDISKTGQYYMAHVKANWSKKGASIAYEFTGDKFSWGGEYNVNPMDSYEISHTPRGKARSFIMSVLRNGPVPIQELIKLAEQEGLTERTLNRAKRDVARSFQKDHKWYWELEPGVEPLPEVIGSSPENYIASLSKIAPGVSMPQAEPEKITEQQKLLQWAEEQLQKGANGNS